MSASLPFINIINNFVLPATLHGTNAYIEWMLIVHQSGAIGRSSIRTNVNVFAKCFAVRIHSLGVAVRSGDGGGEPA